VIVSDIVMPRMTGMELLRTIRSLAPFAQVIMITGEPTVETAAEAVRGGACDYLSKPVCKNAIVRCVRNAARIKAADDERRRLEQANREQMAQIERQNAELRQASAFREEVEQITRHDLKSPLSVILGVPPLMIDLYPDLNAKQRQYLGMVEKAGLRMLEMINRSLDLFKIEYGLYNLHREPVDLLEVLRDAADDSAALREALDLEVRILAGGAPVAAEQRCVAVGERHLLYCLLANLMKNAMEASPRGGAVTVDVDDADSCAVRVHNRGAVPEEIRDRMFQKFVTAGKTHGTGLGAYSARLIAELHGGTISLDASEAGATTVTVSLPKASAVPAPERAAARGDACRT